jgi:glyoxylate carboligase
MKTRTQDVTGHHLDNTAIQATGYESRGRVSRSLIQFGRHYLEMVAAMILGMVVLGGASEMLLDLPDETTVILVEMAIAMTVPMVLWMRFRGHGWRVTNEMAAAMLIPAAGALLVLSAGIVKDEMALLVFEHVAMFVGMLVAMLVRFDEYAGHHHHISQEAPE